MNISSLIKRSVTSLLLLILFLFMFYSNIVLILSLILFGMLALIELNQLFLKIFKKNFYILLCNTFSFIYLFLIFALIYFVSIKENFIHEYKLYVFYSIAISICADIGGYIIGNLFKGKNLTKISPNKTISGSIGSFLFQ